MMESTSQSRPVASPAVRQEIHTRLCDFCQGRPWGELFMPASEVDVDSFVLQMPGIEWCVGLEEFGRLFDSGMGEVGELRLATERETVSAEGDTAWLAATGNMTLVLPSEMIISEYFSRLQQSMSRPHPAAIISLRQRAGRAAKELFEMAGGDKFRWTFRLSAVLVKRSDGWRFQQIRCTMK